MKMRALLGSLVAFSSPTESSVGDRRSETLRALRAKVRDATPGRAQYDAARARLASGTPVMTTTTSGPIVGVDSGGVTQFLGIPFAAPPVGDLRWAPPVAATPWTSPRNTSYWGPACPQDPEFAIFGLFSGMSEDCLFVDVYVPSAQPPPGGWPTLVWIYPGGYIFGTGGFPGWDGFFPISGLHLNVSIVTIAYRVNAFGFLGGSALRAADGTIGTWGSADQRFALQFVNANAKAFNLDPSRITVWGVSAGGASVSHLLTNPRAFGTFNRAIVESGAMAEWISFSLDDAQALYDKYAAAANCTANGSPAAQVACLRALPWEALVAVSALDFLSTERWGPVVDGVEVPDWPRNMAAQGKVAPGVQLLIGSNHDEGTMFAVPDDIDLGMASEAELASAFNKTFGAALVPDLLGLYPPSRFNNSLAVDGVTPFWQAFARAVGDSMISCPSRDQARWLSSPNRTGGAAPVFAWHFLHQLELFRELSPYLGVCHGTDVIFVMDFQPWATWGFGETALTDEMMGVLVRFATTGDPSGGAVPHWPAYSAQTDLVVTIDTGVSGVNFTAVANLRQAECDWWMEHQVVHPPPPGGDRLRV